MNDEPQSLRAALAKCREAADRFAEDACTQRERADCEMTERLRAEKRAERAEAEVARLREAMPSAEERDAIAWSAGYSKHERNNLSMILDFLARLPARLPAPVSDECTRCNGVGALLVGGSARVGCSTCNGTGRAKGGDDA
jgi:hypothetical protein